MSSLLRHHAAEQRPTDQGKVADEIKRLVTAALVFKSEAARIRNPIASETNSVIQAGPPDQPHIPHLIQLIFKTERPGGCNLPRIGVGCYVQLENLVAYQRVVKEVVAPELKAVTRQNSDAFAIRLHADRT